MKKNLLLIIGIFLISLMSFGQAASSYTFTAISGSYIPLTGVPGVVDTSLGATADIGVSTSITLPFALTFAGTAYTSIKVSPNGWLSFGAATVTDAQNNTNSLVNAGVAKPILFPLWDDLTCTVKPRYITTGIFPHRRFKVEWSQQKWDSQATGDVISFQVWFFETTNVIEFLYNQGASAVSNTTGGASIGIYDANGKYLTLNNSGATPTAEYNTFTTDIGTKPATGQIYRFTPPPTTGLEANKYCFTAASVPYQILTGTTDVAGVSSVEDDGLSNTVTLQFPFTFGGNVYTDLKVSSNGWLTFGTASPSLVQNYVNDGTNAAVSKPILMPLWDDLKCTVKPRYVTTGVAPNRIFKLGWLNQKWNYQGGEAISFQVWLYEGSNTIEYYYSQNAAPVNAGSATIGIYDANGSYLTLSNSGSNSTAQSAIFTTNISTKPASGQMYRFTPPPIIKYPGNAYIAIGKVGVTQTGATGGTYTATPAGLVLNSSTGEVNLSASAGGTYTIVYAIGGCASATAVMTIFSLLPVPTATVTPATCTSASDGAITITNMNNAVKFIRADNDYIDLGSPMLSNRSAFTIEGWIKFNIADVTGRVSLFGQNDAIEFGFSNSTTIELWTAATGVVTAALPASLGDGAWHHVAAVGNGSTVKIYLNGASVAVTGGVTSTSNYGSSSYNTKIGSGVYNPTGDSFTGQLLKLGLYNRALSALEIIYVAIGPTTYSGFESGIIAGYNVEVGSGTTLFSYPAGNNGTFQNTPEWIDPYNYNWQKINDVSFTAVTKNLINLTPGDYKVTVSLIGVSSPNAAIFTVGSATLVTAVAGTGASCSNSFTANWSASSGATSYTIDVATDVGFTTFVGGYNDFNVGNVTSYALTGLPPGNIYYRVYKNSSCGKSSFSNVITYATLQINSPTAMGGTAITCNGFTANWNAVSGATAYYLDISTNAAFSSFVSGYNSLNVGNVTTLVVTPLASGFTYYYRVRSYDVTCGIVATPSNVIPVIIIPGPTAPIVGLIKQITCTMPGGSVALSGLPTGSWTLSLSSGELYSGSGATVTIPSLVAGTYTTAVSAGACFSVNSSPIVINTSTITPTTWNGTAWSNGIPSALKRVAFDGGVSDVYTINSNLNMCSCQVNSGTVVVNSGVVMVVEDILDVTSTANITFENNASLVQINDEALNAGSILYKRNTTPMKNFDYTHWCSPVANQVLNVLSPNTLPDKYFSYANGAWVEESGNNTMSPAGNGFIIRVPKPNILFPNGEYWTGSTYIQNAKFNGVPNNGVILIASQGVSKDNLIGNPYPSSIDADSFILDPGNAAIIDGALYFWTHNTNITQSGSQYVYNSNDYATYTLTGGAGTGVGAGASTGGGTPLGKIAAGQSFFVVSKATGNFKFNNSMRVVGSNSQFFKMSNTKKTTIVEKNRVWLNLTNDGGAFKQLLVGYVTNATNDLDNLYDGVSFDGNTYIDFYSVNNATNLTIQGRALPFNKTDEVPLGYKTKVEGVFAISIDQTDGALTNQDVFLEDKTTNVIHNLKKGPYSFTTLKGTFDNRFVLIYVDKTKTVVPPVVILDPTLGNPDYNKENKGLVVSINDRVINIHSFEEAIAKVMVYDLRGRLLFEKRDVNSTEFIIQNLDAANQVLIIKVQLKDGKWSTNQIIF